MVSKMIQSILMWILIIFILASWVDAQPKYPETISVLKEIYVGEIQPHLNYLAYAQKANSENYPNIAHLFTALATSESIHARNFRKLSSDLGVDVKGTPKPEVKVSSTKENLKNAVIEWSDDGFPF